MPDMDSPLPYDTGTVHDFRQMIARHAQIAEDRFGELSRLMIDRPEPLSAAEARDHLVANFASQYGWATVSLIGFIAAKVGEEAAWEAAAMVEGMAHNGGAPYTEDVPQAAADGAADGATHLDPVGGP